MIKRLVNRPTEFTISFSDKCDGCGICAKYCPYEALKAEKVTRKGVQA
jgi:ferredoxin